MQAHAHNIYLLYLYIHKYYIYTHVYNCIYIYIHMTTHASDCTVPPSLLDASLSRLVEAVRFRFFVPDGAGLEAFGSIRSASKPRCNSWPQLKLVWAGGDENTPAKMALIRRRIPPPPQSSCLLPYAKVFCFTTTHASDCTVPPSLLDASLSRLVEAVRFRFLVPAGARLEAFGSIRSASEPGCNSWPI